MLIILPTGPEAGLQDQPQAGAARAGAASLRHRAGHEGGPGLVPKQVNRLYTSLLYSLFFEKSDLFKASEREKAKERCWASEVGPVL